VNLILEFEFSKITVSTPNEKEVWVHDPWKPAIAKAVWMTAEIPKLDPRVSLYYFWTKPLAPGANVRVFEAILVSEVTPQVVDWLEAATSNITSKVMCFNILNIYNKEKFDGS